MSNYLKKITENSAFGFLNYINSVRKTNLFGMNKTLNCFPVSNWGPQRKFNLKLYSEKFDWRLWCGFSPQVVTCPPSIAWKYSYWLRTLESPIRAKVTFSSDLSLWKHSLISLKLFYNFCNLTKSEWRQFLQVTPLEWQDK